MVQRYRNWNGWILDKGNDCMNVNFNYKHEHIIPWVRIDITFELFFPTTIRPPGMPKSTTRSAKLMTLRSPWNHPKNKGVLMLLRKPQTQRRNQRLSLQPRVLQKNDRSICRPFAFDLLLNTVWPGHAVRALGEICAYTWSMWTIYSFSSCVSKWIPNSTAILSDFYGLYFGTFWNHRRTRYP